MKNKNTSKENKPSIKKAFTNSFNSFLSILPLMIAISALVSLFQVYITSSMLSSLFGYSNFSDNIIGTLTGAIATGQGAISYIIAKGLQTHGVSIYAITSFILAWVSLGFIQLPAEVSVFGIKFTVIRNILALFSTILISYLTIITVEILK